MRRDGLFLAGLVSLLLTVMLWPFGAFAETDLYSRLEGFDLVDQDGRQAELREGYIGENLAVVTFTFSSCTTVCPMLDGIFKKVQDMVGEELGQEVTLLTISVDPQTDIPERLKERAEKLAARPGWYFLTGEKQRVDDVLRAFEVYTPDIFNHPPTVFVLDGRTHASQRLNGFPTPKAIHALIKEYQATRDEV